MRTSRKDECGENDMKDRKWQEARSNRKEQQEVRQKKIKEGEKRWKHRGGGNKNKIKNRVRVGKNKE